MVDGQTYMWYSIVKKTHVVKFWPKYGINMNKFVPCPYLLNSSNCLFGSSVSNWPCNNVFILVVDCVIIWRERTLFNDSYKKWLTISFIWYFYNRHSHKTITTDIRKSKKPNTPHYYNYPQNIIKSCIYLDIHRFIDT